LIENVYLYITWIVFLHSLSDCRSPPVINLSQTTLFPLSFKIKHRGDMVKILLYIELQTFLRIESDQGAQSRIASGNVRYERYKYENDDTKYEREKYENDMKYTNMKMMAQKMQCCGFQ